MVVETLRSRDASPALLRRVRCLLAEAFDDLSEEDWEHALGGWHVVAREGCEVVAHAAVVERALEVGGRLLRAGYVEGVATAPSRQGRGLGSAVMSEVAVLLAERFELGALSTGRHAFYERLGWERWRGPTFVRHGDERSRTEEEDDGIMVWRRQGVPLDLRAPLTCEARDGDDW